LSYILNLYAIQQFTGNQLLLMYCTDRQHHQYYNTTNTTTLPQCKSCDYSYEAFNDIHINRALVLYNAALAAAPAHQDPVLRVAGQQLAPKGESFSWPSIDQI